jgi:hypothetical protein
MCLYKCYDACKLVRRASVRLCVSVCECVCFSSSFLGLRLLNNGFNGVRRGWQDGQVHAPRISHYDIIFQAAATLKRDSGGWCCADGEIVV